MFDDLLLLLARTALADTGGVGPLDDLVAAVVEDVDQTPGEPLPPAGVRALLPKLAGRDSPLVLVGDTLVDVTVVAEGAVFTHRLSTSEVDGDRLHLDPDLSTLARLATADGGLHRPDGTPLPLRTIRRPGEGRCGATLYQRQLACPKGWLASFGPGTLVAVRPREGLVYIDVLGETEIVDAGSIGPTLRDPMLAAIEAANDGLHAAVFAEELQVAGLVEGWHQPTASAPPFGEVAAAAGYEVDGASVGEAGWWATKAWVGHAIEVATRHAHQLDGDEAEPLTGFLQAFIEWRSDRSIDLDPQLAARLRRSPEAAIGLEEELVRLDPGGHDLLGFLDRLGPPDARAVAVVETLRALGADLTGDPVAAEAHVDAALASTPDWFPAIEARIHFLSARGRARETVNLLQHIRQPDDHQLAVMRDRFKASTTSVRRNDPCPCGSGRKSKHCHQGRVELPGDVRVTWLLDKARDHLHRLAPPHLLDELLVGPAIPSASDQIYLLAMDNALFDQGWFERFLASRRHLLPAEEVRLAEGWAGRDRASVYRVTGIGDDATLTLVDQADHAEYRVARTAAFETTAVDDLVWTRLLPDDDRHWCSGMARPVSLVEREPILTAIHADPHDHYRALLGLDAAVNLAAPDGHPLVSATATWSVGTDRVPVEATLDAIAERDGNDEWVVLDGDSVTITFLLVEPFPFDDEVLEPDEIGLGEPDADEPWFGSDGEPFPGVDDEPAPSPGLRLVVHSISVARHQEAIDLVRRVLPQAEVLSDVVVPVAREQALARQDEIYEALWSDEIYETLWSDEMDDDLWRDDHWDPEEADGDESLGPDEADEEAAREAMAAFIDRYERAWVDRPLPALGDRTPRQAAADPSLAPDLRTLLRQLDRTDAFLSVDRLRALLGLDAT